MKEDFSLRRRTRDSSWQWLMMGVIVGMGFALVVCVGGYALDAIKFPALEDKTPEKTAAAGGDVQVAIIQPNPTDIALQATATMLSLTQQAMALPTATTASEQSAPAATQEATVQPTPLPSPLPGSTEEVVNSQPTTDQSTNNTAFAAGENTPVMGTPLAAAPTQTITFAGEPSIPPELDAIKTEMVTVNGGSFMMGTTTQEATAAMDECALYNSTCPYEWAQDSTPEHQVTVDSFEMDIYEVTMSQYVTFLNWMGPNSHKNGCQGQPCVLTDQEEPNSQLAFDGQTYSVKYANYNNHPVNYVTWWGAEAYCEALNRRLPTEAEWEHAARGPQNFIYPWGNTYDTTLANSSRPAAEDTEPVGNYLAGVSAFGLYDMAGNVWEWVSDWYQADYYNQFAGNPVSNPKGPISGTQKVLRGGSWDALPPLLRSVYRFSWDPADPKASMGFRCVKDIRGGGAAAAPVNTNTGNISTGSGAPTMPAAQVPIQPTITPVGPTATLAPG